MEFTKPDDSASVSKPSESFLTCISSTTIMSNTNNSQCRNSNHNNSSINPPNSNLRSNSNTSPNTNINGYSNTQHILSKCKCLNQIAADSSDSLRKPELADERLRLNLNQTLMELILNRNLSRWLTS